MAKTDKAKPGDGALRLSSIAATLILVSMRLDGHIGWPWLWVLSPTWLGLVVTVAGASWLAMFAERRRVAKLLMDEP